MEREVCQEIYCYSEQWVERLELPTRRFKKYSKMGASPPGIFMKLTWRPRCRYLLAPHPPKVAGDFGVWPVGTPPERALASSCVLEPGVS